MSSLSLFSLTALFSIEKVINVHGKKIQTTSPHTSTPPPPADALKRGQPVLYLPQEHARYIQTYTSWLLFLQMETYSVPCLIPHFIPLSWSLFHISSHRSLIIFILLQLHSVLSYGCSLIYLTSPHCGGHSGYLQISAVTNSAGKSILVCSFLSLSLRWIPRSWIDEETAECKRKDILLLIEIARLSVMHQSELLPPGSENACFPSVWHHFSICIR